MVVKDIPGLATSGTSTWSVNSRRIITFDPSSVRSPTHNDTKYYIFSSQKVSTPELLDLLILTAGIDNLSLA